MTETIPSKINGDDDPAEPEDDRRTTQEGQADPDDPAWQRNRVGSPGHRGSPGRKPLFGR